MQRQRTATATLKPSAATKNALKRQRKALTTTLALTVSSTKTTINVKLNPDSHSRSSRLRATADS